MKRALVLSLVMVLGLGVASFGAGVLSGSWDSTITIVPSPTAITAFDSNIKVEYTISGWTFGSVTTIDLAGWTDQEFGFSGSLGAFTLGGTLDFTPVPGAFDYLLVSGGVPIGGVKFGATALLEGNDLGVELTGAGTAGDVTISVTVGFGDIGVKPAELGGPGLAGNGACDLDWNSFTAVVKFPFDCAKITATVMFDCAGFKSACFQVDNILVPNLPWFDIDAKVCFARLVTNDVTTYEKSFYLKPGFTLGTIACFDVFAYLDISGWGEADDPITLGSITFNGFGITTTFAGVTFTALTWLDDTTKQGILADTEYYEAYQIGTSDELCCGSFGFDLTFFFLKDTATLVDVAEVVANLSYIVGPNFTVNTGLTVLMATGFSEWTVGFEVTW
jgi:hypothetical protein